MENSETKIVEVKKEGFFKKGFNYVKAHKKQFAIGAVAGVVTCTGIALGIKHFTAKDIVETVVEAVEPVAEAITE